MSAAVSSAPTGQIHEKKICVECDRPDFRLNVPVKGLETIIAGALKEFEQPTFDNCWEYFVFLLDMKPNPAYGQIEGCVEKITSILNDWTAIHGDKATVAYLNCCLRQHRTIVHKIRKECLLALGYHDNLPPTP
jgi:hypothetical protein